MDLLKEMFPSLALFSDIDWSAVAKEYREKSGEISFPEYLQIKAEMGDCPPYLYEIAFYEMALATLENEEVPLPPGKGPFLNPTAMFLALEFDVSQMLEKANHGTPQVIERSHVLCLYRDAADEICGLELDQNELKLLQQVEEGPLLSLDGIDLAGISRFVRLGLIIDRT